MTATGVAPRQTMAIPDVPSGEVERGEGPWPGLAVAAAEVGVPLSGEQVARFAAFRDLLLARGARTNLTAIREPAEVERRLFLDALRLVPALDTVVAERAAGDSTPRLVDVGSGAGFPGLVLKVVRPELDATLIEATGKKVAFLREAIAAFGLDGVVAEHGRAEDLARRPEHRGRYDVATARAVAALPVLLELCAPFLKPGGIGLFPKGIEIDEELAAANRAAPLVGARLVGADALSGGTRMVRIVKEGATPDRYPRRAGLPAHDPLGAAGRASPAAGGRAPDASAGQRPTAHAGRGEG